jgi:hypothetical protein
MTGGEEGLGPQTGGNAEATSAALFTSEARENIASRELYEEHTGLSCSILIY